MQMLSILLAVVTAVAFGIADFLTGLASRRMPLFQAILLAQITNLLATLSIALVIGGAPTHLDYIYGVWAGVVVLVAASLLIVCLRDGKMGEVLPIAAVTTLAFPVLYNAAKGIPIAGGAWIGIALAAIAVALVNRSAGDDESGAKRSKLPLLIAFVSGIAWGLFFTVTATASHENNIWIIVVSNITRLILLLLALPFMMQKYGFAILSGGTGQLIALANGVVFALSFMLYFLAMHSGGNLALVNAITSQGVIITVACASIFLREKIYPVQAVGLAAGVVSISLIAYYA